MESSSTRRVLAVLLASVVALGGLSGVAVAQTGGGLGGSIVVEEGETVGGLDLLAGSLVVRGTVDGDVTGVAGSVRVAAGGVVTGSVDLAAGAVDIDGTVQGDVDVAAGSVSVGPDGVVGGTLVVGAESLLLAGTVRGDVEAGAERVTVTETTVVDGTLRYDADAAYTQADGATVAGGAVAVANLGGGGFLDGLGDGFGDGLGAAGWLFSAYWAVATFLVGAVTLYAFPRFTGTVAGTVADRPLVSGGVGLLGLVGGPVLALALAVTVVGLPASLLVLMLFGLAVFVGAVLAEYAVGSWLLSLADVENRYAALVVGVVVVAVLAQLPVVGWVLNPVVLLLGFGALLLALRASYRAARARGPDGAAGDTAQTTLTEPLGEGETDTDAGSGSDPAA